VQKLEGKRKKNSKKRAQNLTGHVSTCSQLATNGRPPAKGGHLIYQVLCHLLKFLKFFLKFFLEVWVMGQGFWENGCIVPPFFEAYPYTWKC
jgi:hypothetical protein